MYVTFVTLRPNNHKPDCICIRHNLVPSNGRRSLFLTIILLYINVLVNTSTMDGATAWTRPDTSGDPTLVKDMIDVLQFQTFGFWEEYVDDWNP